MMKQYYSIIVACFILVACGPSRPDNQACSTLKDGAFKMVDSESGTEYLITRSGDIQTEINLSTQDTAMYSVSWGDNCFYRLNLISGPEWMIPLWEKNELTVKITSIAENQYKCRAKFSNSPTILNNTIEILN